MAPKILRHGWLLRAWRGHERGLGSLLLRPLDGGHRHRPCRSRRWGCRGHDDSAKASAATFYPAYSHDDARTTSRGREWNYPTPRGERPRYSYDAYRAHLGPSVASRPPFHDRVAPC